MDRCGFSGERALPARGHLGTGSETATFDLRALPENVEDFFRGAIDNWQGDRRPLLTATLGLLSTSRKPLSARELAQNHPKRGATRSFRRPSVRSASS